MKVCVSVVCLLILAAMTACEGDVELKIEPVKPVIVHKVTASSNTINIPGDITTLTIK